MDPSDTARSTSPLPPLAPLQNPKYRHISRSAAKRESVQLLGSIKDLQLHFARAGLVEHKPGVGVGLHGLGSVSETEGDEENTPPVASSSRIRRPWKDVEMPRVDVVVARREVRGIIARVRNLWGMGMSSSMSMVMSPSMADFPESPMTASGSGRSRGTGGILVDTAKTIRRVRDLALSVVAQTGTRRVSGPPPASIKARHRQGFSTPSRPSSGMPRAVSYTHGERSKLSDDGTKEDPQADLRRCALEVLAGLRVLEERLRIDYAPSESDYGTSERVMSPDRSSSSSGMGSSSTRPTSTSFTEAEAYDSEEEDYNINAMAQGATPGESVKTWEERIVAERREYRELQEEGEKVDTVRESVRRWIGVVENLFGVREGEVGELESWARDEWEGRDLHRLHAFLLAHLPLNLQVLLPQTAALTLREDLLTRLSDGFILTQAYNTAISFSPKAWGFIPPEDIYDTLRLNDEDNDEAARDKEWTFRRVGNLTCWAAALRLRYNLPIQLPTSTVTLAVPLVFPPPRSSSSSATSTPSRGPIPLERQPPKKKDTVPRVDFDPMVVAKRGEGWEEMMLQLLVRWVDEASREARESLSHHERASAT